MYLTPCGYLARPYLKAGTGWARRRSRMTDGESHGIRASRGRQGARWGRGKMKTVDGMADLGVAVIGSKRRARVNIEKKATLTYCV